MPSVFWLLKQFFMVVPDAWHQEMISQLVNHLIRGQPQAPKFASLEGAIFRLVISDTGNQWQFRMRHGKLHPDHRFDRGWDVCIRGSLQDFLLLALRIDDPDTLFFSRRLSLEGKTELGLYFKNVLDSWEFDWPAHINAVIGEQPAQAVLEALRRTRLEHGLTMLGRGIRRSVRDMMISQNPNDAV